MLIGRLKHEKAILCATLSTAGIPVPLFQGGAKLNAPKPPFGDWQGNQLAPLGLRPPPAGHVGPARNPTQPPSPSAFTVPYASQSQGGFQLGHSTMFGHNQGVAQPSSQPVGSGSLANGKPGVPSPSHMVTYLWTLRGFYVGRRYTQALGCVTSNKRIRVPRFPPGANFSPYLFDGVCYEGYLGQPGEAKGKKK